MEEDLKEIEETFHEQTVSSEDRGEHGRTWQKIFTRKVEINSKQRNYITYKNDRRDLIEKQFLS